KKHPLKTAFVATAMGLLLAAPSLCPAQSRVGAQIQESLDIASDGRCVEGAAGLIEIKENTILPDGKPSPSAKDENILMLLRAFREIERICPMFDSSDCNPLFASPVRREGRWGQDTANAKTATP
ncbi:MAG TPA: hypothetical protein DCY07_01185, partial [Rhodospirillaceae bacterium]|nr:hypothetical protein [Rhodospirillaceae bacterium]